MCVLQSKRDGDSEPQLSQAYLHVCWQSEEESISALLLTHKPIRELSSGSSSRHRLGLWCGFTRISQSPYLPSVCLILYLFDSFPFFQQGFEMTGGFFASVSTVWMTCDHNAVQSLDSPTDRNQTLDLLQLHIRRQEWHFLGPRSRRHLFLDVFCAQNRVRSEGTVFIRLGFGLKQSRCVLCVWVVSVCTVKEKKKSRKGIISTETAF